MDFYRYIELGAVTVLAVGLLRVVRATLEKMLAQTAAREIAQRKVDQEFRKEMAETQERIAVILENHLSTISQYMGQQTEMLRAAGAVDQQSVQFMAVASEALRDIQKRLLDRALRAKPRKTK